MPDETRDGPQGETQTKQQERMLEKVIGLSLKLLFIEDQGDLAEGMGKIIMDAFPVRSMIIMIQDEETGMIVPRAVFGYPPERVAEIKEKAVYGIDEVDESAMSAMSTPLGRFSKFFPVELAPDDPRDLIATLETERTGEPRKDPNSWHPMDRADIRLLDRSGREIGAIYVTSTKTGEMLDEASVDGLEIVASIASVALDLTRLRAREQMMLDSQEKRAAQMSQILTVSNSILTLTNPGKLIDRTLELIDNLFGFKSGSIALYDEVEKCYRWTAFKGYSDEQLARGKGLSTPKDIMEHDIRPEMKISYLAHFKPAEKTFHEDLEYFWEFPSANEAENALKIPRENPDSWHPMDDLSFTILDRTGKTIGILSTDNPVDGKIPSRENIELIEVFVSLVAIALENAHIYEETARARDEVHILNRLMFHDLMNYSMAIRGYLDLSLSTTDKTIIERHLDKAMKQVDQTAELIGKVRKLSAIRSADKRNFLRIDLANTIRIQASKTAGLFPSKMVKFGFDLSGSEAFVMANDLLPDLFHNIFMNAIKFDMHENVSIDVALKEEVEESEAGGDIKFWRVSVADNGPGIPDDRKMIVFLGSSKPVHTELPRGMGLGLSIVKSLVDLYGGKVWVEDRERGHYEKGARFLVRLPQA